MNKFGQNGFFGHHTPWSLHSTPSNFANIWIDRRRLNNGGRQQERESGSLIEGRSMSITWAEWRSGLWVTAMRKHKLRFSAKFPCYWICPQKKSCLVFITNINTFTGLVTRTTLTPAQNGDISLHDITQTKELCTVMRRNVLWPSPNPKQIGRHSVVVVVTPAAAIHSLSVDKLKEDISGHSDFVEAINEPS